MRLIASKKLMLESYRLTAINIMSNNQVYAGWSRANMLTKMQDKVDDGTFTNEEVKPIVDILV